MQKSVKKIIMKIIGITRENKNLVKKQWETMRKTSKKTFLKRNKK